MKQPYSLVRTRKQLILLAFIVLAISSWLLVGWAESGKEAGEAYDWVQIKKSNIEEVVTAQGKLEPKEYVDVGAQVSGQLQKIHAEIGDTVEAGKLLAEIDPRIYEARVQEDKAKIRTLQSQIAEQEAQIVLARKQYQRNQRLIESKAISQETLDDTDTALTVAQAQAEALKAQLEEAESGLKGDVANLSYTKIYAPMAGTVVVQDIREGQTINASQSAPTITRLANLDTMTVRAQVAEADVMRLQPDMPVYFTTLGALDRKWQGKVRQILPSPEVINDVVLYNVLVDVDNSDRQLMTGMSTQMFFVLGKAENVLVIPVGALIKRMPEKNTEAGQAYQVKVKDGGDVEEKIVHIGLMNRNIAEVKAGLEEKEEVAIPAKRPEKKREGQQGRVPRGPQI